MENINLEKGKCANCKGPIDLEWAGNDPSIGTLCRECSNRVPEPIIFEPRHIQFNVNKDLIFDPLMEEYEYHFEFRGSKIMINNKVGIIFSTQADGSWVRFSENDRLGEFIRGLGYMDLIRLYKGANFDINPPMLFLPECQKEKINLLNKPIVPLIINSRDSPEPIITAIYIGDEFGLSGNKIPFIQSLHAFTNLYTRYKFGLAANYCFEGGFVGNGFEIRNLVGAIGITVNMDPMDLKHNSLKDINDWKDLEQSIKVQMFVNMAYEREQNRSEVVKKDADVNEILSFWVRIMETLLRYDWTKEKMETVEDIWHNYCVIQNILRNIMTDEEIERAFAYARENKLVHYGIKY